MVRSVLIAALLACAFTVSPASAADRFVPSIEERSVSMPEISVSAPDMPLPPGMAPDAHVLDHTRDSVTPADGSVAAINGGNLRRGGRGAGVTERILSFHTDAVFLPDATLELTEHITVQATGVKIKRGIFRSLPTVWTRRDNKRFRNEYTVVGVLKNGKREPYSVSRANDMMTIRTGSKDVLLTRGVYEYAITYRLANALSRFPKYDELYFNVTGNEWAFPIDKASFHLSFRNKDGSRRDVPIISSSAYTGVFGSTRQNARKLSDGSYVTTTPLGMREGLTVAYAWDRAVFANVADPEEDSLLKRLFVPDHRSFFLWIVPLVLAAYFFITRRRMAADLAMPEVIPLFRVPDGLSPGEIRRILFRSYDADSFAGDLLTLVTKGAASLVPGARPPALKKGGVPNRNAGAMDQADRTAVQRLFSGGSTVVMSKANNTTLRSVRSRFATRAASENAQMFQERASKGLLGVLIFVALPVLAFFVPGEYDLAPATFLMVFNVAWFGGISFAAYSMFRSASGIGRFFVLIPLAPFFIAGGAMLFGLIGPFLMEFILPDGYIGALSVSMLILIVGFLGLPKYTQKGLNRLAVAKGLKMYLGTAEEKRFEALYPPEDSVERFEALLPFALALGVGETWANRFSSYLAVTGKSAQQLHSVSSWRDLRSFSRIGGASSRPPVSSSSGRSGRSGSGSFGGGSSGGGRGGGGGGGW